jgi:phenylpyruvate tautomerase PptA (4-oxalocrotonate tautomerase family)
VREIRARIKEENWKQEKQAELIRDAGLELPLRERLLDRDV